MQRIQLSRYVERKGQAGAAGELGCTQAAIGKALRAKRKIYVTIGGDKVTAKEIKPFPSTTERLADA